MNTNYRVIRRHVKNFQKGLDAFFGGRLMARIPEHEIERLKQEVSVQRLAEAQGIKLERHGTHLRGLCPVQDDPT
jgi:hypothetical protein